MIVAQNRFFVQKDRVPLPKSVCDIRAEADWKALVMLVLWSSKIDTIRSEMTKRKQEIRSYLKRLKTKVS